MPLPRLLSLVLCSVCLLLHSQALGGPDSPIPDDEGRPIVAWDHAKEIAGKLGYVYGKVLDVKKAGRITFINFDKARPAKFAGVIFEDSLKNFPTPPAELYTGKIVRIRGIVSIYRNQAEISVSKPEQVEILDSMPQTVIPAKVAQRSTKPGEVRIAAYNILNLFDDVDDPYKADEGTPAKPRAQLEAVAKSIRELDADVIAFEEIENRDYLKRFIEVFLPDMGYNNVVLVEGNDTRGIDVALASRIPVGEVRSHQYSTYPAPGGGVQRFMRDVLAVELRPEGKQPFEAWVIHLKSNSDGREYAEPVRLAEAKELRRLLDEKLTKAPDTRLVVMGDFNDTWGTETLKTIVGEGDGALWSAGSDSADKDAVSYNKGEFRSVIDFMLCSPEMAKAYVKGSYKMPQGSVETTGSDHNPIEATFSLP